MTGPHQCRICGKWTRAVNGRVARHGYKTNGRVPMKETLVSGARTNVPITGACLGSGLILAENCPGGQTHWEQLCNCGAVVIEGGGKSNA